MVQMKVLLTLLTPTKTHRPSMSALSAIFVLKENGTQSYSAKLLRKILKVLRCSRAKKRQRNCTKKCAARAKLIFC